MTQVLSPQLSTQLSHSLLPSSLCSMIEDTGSSLKTLLTSGAKVVGAQLPSANQGLDEGDPGRVTDSPNGRDNAEQHGMHPALNSMGNAPLSKGPSSSVGQKQGARREHVAFIRDAKPECGKVIFKILYTDGSVVEATPRNIYDYVTPAALQEYEHDCTKKGENMETLYFKSENQGGYAGGTPRKIINAFNELVRKTRKNAGILESEQKVATIAVEIKQPPPPKWTTRSARLKAMGDPSEQETNGSDSGDEDDEQASDTGGSKPLTPEPVSLVAKPKVMALGNSVAKTPTRQADLRRFFHKASSNSGEENESAVQLHQESLVSNKGSIGRTTKRAKSTPDTIFQKAKRTRLSDTSESSISGNNVDGFHRYPDPEDEDWSLYEDPKNPTPRPSTMRKDLSKVPLSVKRPVLATTSAGESLTEAFPRASNKRARASTSSSNAPVRKKTQIKPKSPMPTNARQSARSKGKEKAKVDLETKPKDETAQAEALSKSKGKATNHEVPQKSTKGKGKAVARIIVDTDSEVEPRNRGLDAKSEVEDVEYDVEAILDHQNTSGTDEFLVKWQGWGLEHCTWEPMDHLLSSIELVEKYLEKTNSKPGSSK